MSLTLHHIEQPRASDRGRRQAGSEMSHYINEHVPGYKTQVQQTLVVRYSLPAACLQATFLYRTRQALVPGTDTPSNRGSSSPHNNHLHGWISRVDGTDERVEVVRSCRRWWRCRGPIQGSIYTYYANMRLQSSGFRSPRPIIVDHIAE